MTVREKMSGKEHRFKLLNICEFTSTRKRQSCIYRDEKNRIILMCKGADAIMTELLSHESRNSDVFHATKDFVDDFARQGLRTLFLA